MISIVVDASALIDYLMRVGGSERVQDIVQSDDSDLHIPDLCDVEVVAGVRRATVHHRLDVERATALLADYIQLPVRRHAHRHLVRRIFDLRNTFTAYDATYIALAEALDARLLTEDARLAKAARKFVALA